MHSIDEAVVKLKSNNTKASIRVNAQVQYCCNPSDSFNDLISSKSFPRPKMRVSGYDVVAANGGVWFYIPPMITFFILLTEIVMEKVIETFGFIWIF